MDKKPKYCKLIKTDGSVTNYPPANGKKYTLKELQAAVGGLITFVDTKDGKATFVCHDEALLVAEPQYNVVATMMAIALTGLAYELFGDVLLVSMDYIDTE